MCEVARNSRMVVVGMCSIPCYTPSNLACPMFWVRDGPLASSFCLAVLRCSEIQWRRLCWSVIQGTQTRSASKQMLRIIMLWMTWRRRVSVYPLTGSHLSLCIRRLPCHWKSIGKAYYERNVCRFAAAAVLTQISDPLGGFSPLEICLPLGFPGSCQSRMICTPTLWFRKIKSKHQQSVGLRVFQDSRACSSVSGNGI